MNNIHKIEKHFAEHETFSSNWLVGYFEIQLPRKPSQLRVWGVSATEEYVSVPQFALVWEATRASSLDPRGLNARLLCVAARGPFA